MYQAVLLLGMFVSGAFCTPSPLHAVSFHPPDISLVPAGQLAIEVVPAPHALLPTTVFKASSVALAHTPD